MTPSYVIELKATVEEQKKTIDTLRRSNAQWIADLEVIKGELARTVDNRNALQTRCDALERRNDELMQQVQKRKK
jgi:chromosome segregation ATPase